MKQLLTALYLSLTAFAVSSVGCGSPLVGLECEDGFNQCGGGCFDPNSDPNHCGGCNVQCASDEMCISGGCTDEFDSSTPGDGGDGDSSNGDAGDAGGDAWPDPGDGGMDADTDSGEGGSGEAGTGEGGATDGGFPDVDLPPLCMGPGSPADCVCELGELICQESCVNPSVDLVNCGACGNDCNVVPPPLGQFFCINGSCVLNCDPPYRLCGSLCLDTDNDPDNCGGCGTVCESGLCELGICLDATAGHVIVIGHDLSSPVNTAAVRRIAENAMFLPPKATIRGLIYKEFSTASAQAGVESVINAVSAAGRTFNRVAGPAGATADEVPFLLAQSDVFIIISQGNATDSALRDRGDSWSRALQGFVRRGGVIVLYDGGGTHAGTQQILEQAGLFATTARASLTPRQVNVEAPGDAVASLVPSRYLSQNETVGYTATDGTVVVSDRMTGLSVVIHIAR